MSCSKLCAIFFMKRKNVSGPAVGSRYDISIDYCSGLLKRERSTVAKSMPPSFLQTPLELDPSILMCLQSVVDGSATDSSKMVTDDMNHLKFLVFLGAQGKEYIDVIHDMFPPHFEQLVFVSLNIATKYANDPSYHCANTHMCKELASYFKILDPLGGGTYPLDYLIVTDSNLLVRCKLPIRVGQHYRPDQRFAVNLLQLQGLVDEYLQFFMQSHITISL